MVSPHIYHLLSAASTFYTDSFFCCVQHIWITVVISADVGHSNIEQSCHYYELEQLKRLSVQSFCSLQCL